MALDGIVLQAITKQLQELLPAKINKIQQLSDTELLFQLRTKNGNKKLLLSFHSVYNRINITNQSYTTLDAPQGFVMLLRKQLDGGMIRSLQQIGLDRILHMEIEARNELGDIHQKHLYIELMGKYANLVFVDENGIILDALKRIPPFENNKRTIHPGAKYQLPAPHLNKQDPYQNPAVDFNTSLVKQLHGFSPLLASEVEYRMQKGTAFSMIMNELQQSDTIYISEQDGNTQFHILPLTHLSQPIRSYPLMKGLDILYHEKEEKVRIKQQTGDIYKTVKQELHRNSGKLPKLKESLQEALDCEKYREYGDLLFAYQGSLKRQPKVTLPSFESGAELTIPLDMRYDIKQNANRYYHKYHKGKRAQDFLQEQIALCEKELRYFEAMKLQLEQANAQDAKEIREELIRLHYMKDTKRAIRKKKKNQLPHYECFHFDDYKIYVGKNNLQNDFVTWKLAKKQDTWFHAKDYHGAHVIVTSAQPNETMIRNAAMLAAWYSEGRYSSSVPVNYCLVKQLKKVPGTQGSFVSLSSYKTIYIDPEAAQIQALIDAHMQINAK